MKNINNVGAAKKQADKIVIAAQASDRQSQSDLNHAEWAQIAPGKVVVATIERAWLYHPTSTEERFSQPMNCAGSLATTQKLLDGAIAAAKYATQSNVKPPALTPTRWVWRLAGAYHSSCFTSRLMEEAAANFAATERWNLQKWALHKADPTIEYRYR